MTRNLTALVLTAAALALVAAGCGGGSSSTGGAYGGESSSAGGAYGGNGGGATTQPAETQPSEGGATVTVATVPKLGKVVVDSGGFTLYDFDKDKGTTSSCYGGCASVWPPLTTTGKPQAEGVSASMLGTTKRKDGTTQVTFAGHPLYTYTADSKPGEANGNNIDLYGGEWYALTPKGEEP
jgi:predicted lipoprotein with Yx(FWY)xxD motif